MAGRFIWVEERLGSIPNPPIGSVTSLFSPNSELVICL